MVRIVCKDKAFGQATIGLFILSDVTSHDKFQRLRRLAAWSGAHVKYGVMRLNVTQDWRHHADQFLPSNDARVFRFIYQFVNSLQAFIFSKQLLRQHHFKH